MYNLAKISSELLDEYSVYSQKFKDTIDIYIVNKLTLEEKTLGELAELIQSDEFINEQLNDIVQREFNNIIDISKEDTEDYSPQEIDKILESLLLIFKNTSSTIVRTKVLRLYYLFKNLNSLASKIVSNKLNRPGAIDFGESSVQVAASISNTVNDRDIRSIIGFKIYDNIVNKANRMLSKSFLNEVNYILKEQDKNTLKYISTVSWSDVSMSPTISDDIEKSITNKFLKNKTLKNKRSKKVIKSRILKNKSKSKYSTAKQAIKNKKRKLSRITTEKGLSLLQIKNLLNRKLHDSVKDNMGSPSEPPIRLRYQTGRFAKSVKVLDVKNGSGRKAALQVYYTYMRYPYDVFLPGGRLYKPQRNPKLIIGQAIRGILSADYLKTKNIRATLI